MFREKPSVPWIRTQDPRSTRHDVVARPLALPQQLVVLRKFSPPCLWRKFTLKMTPIVAHHIDPIMVACLVWKLLARCPNTWGSWAWVRIPAVEDDANFFADFAKTFGRRWRKIWTQKLKLKIQMCKNGWLGPIPGNGAGRPEQFGGSSVCNCVWSRFVLFRWDDMSGCHFFFFFFFFDRPWL